MHRSAIAARFFIDATGDGDLARDLHLPSYRSAQVQPPTACYFLQGEIDDARLQQAVETYGGAYGLQPDWGWSETVPGLAHISMRADTHLKDLLCSRADDLTAAELEGRRRAGAMVRLLNRHTDGRYGLAALCSHVGVRETVHYQTRFQAREMDLLTGKRYEDAILNGTYRVDQHHSETGGITFRYLDGTTCTYSENGKKRCWAAGCRSGSLPAGRRGFTRRKPWTLRPLSATTPTASWPNTSPACAVDHGYHSEWHMPVYVTLTSSWSSLIFGISVWMT